MQHEHVCPYPRSLPLLLQDANTAAFEIGRTLLDLGKHDEAIELSEWIVQRTEGIDPGGYVRGMVMPFGLSGGKSTTDEQHTRMAECAARIEFISTNPFVTKFDVAGGGCGWFNASVAIPEGLQGSLHFALHRGWHARK